VVTNSMMLISNVIQTGELVQKLKGVEWYSKWAKLCVHVYCKQYNCVSLSINCTVHSIMNYMICGV